MSPSEEAALRIGSYLGDCSLETLAELYKLCYGEDEIYQQLQREIEGVEDA